MSLTDTFLMLLTAMFLTILLFGCSNTTYINDCNYSIFTGYDCNG